MHRQRLFSLTVLLIAIGLLAGCGGLSSEPGIVSTSAVPTVTPTAPPDLGYPPAQVNLADGAAIFNDTQGCNQCHGTSGKGDGPVASNFSCKITDFTDANSQRDKSIVAWFGVVTNGNGGDTTCLMPPWKNPLNEQQRWDVTSYIYSLHYSSDMLTQGQKIWQDNCAACHGDHGAGNGPKASTLGRPVPDFTNPNYLITHTDSDLWKTVTNGLGSSMPSFANSLDDNSRWAVVAYLRSMTWNNQTTPTPTFTPQPTDSPTINVTGKLISGTAGMPPLANQPVTLRVIDNTGSSPKDVNTLQATTNTVGAFSFSNLNRQNGLIYVVVTTYSGLSQFSTPIKLASGSNDLDMSFKVYQTTTDPSSIHIDTRQIIVDFVNNTTKVSEAMRIINKGDHIFVGTQQASGHTVSVQINVPANAQQVTLDQNSASQYLVGADSQNNPVIQALSPVTPDQPLLLQYSYILPQTDRLVVSAPTAYPIDELIVYVPQFSATKVEGLSDPNAFAPGNPLQLQDGSYDSYNLQKPNKAGEMAGFVLVGQAQQVTNQRNTLAIVLVIAALLLLGMVVAIWRLNRHTTVI